MKKILQFLFEHKSLSREQAKDALRERLLAAKAADVMYDKANKLDELLGNVYEEICEIRRLLQFSVVSEAAAEHPGEVPSASPGNPNLTPGDLKNAAQALRVFADNHSCVPDAWYGLADKFAKAAGEMK